MAWEEISNNRTSFNKSVIRVDERNGAFIFFSVFARQAEIKKKRFVCLYIDESSHQIAFEFKTTEVEGAYKVNFNKGSFSIRSRPCFSYDIVSRFANNGSGIFDAQKISNRWVISLGNEKVTDFSLSRWKLIKSANRKKDGFILTVNLGRLYFSKDFAKEVELGKKKYVLLSIDNQERKIGFNFFSEQNEANNLNSINGDESKGFYVSSKEVTDLVWVKGVDSTSFNDFTLSKEGNKWAAQLCPAFENSVSREETILIPPNAKGIYRYLSNKVVVYVGKGCIRRRLNEKKRKDWEFDEIQYSIIDDDFNRSKWEGYWISYYEENKGCLPKMNKIHGLRLNKKLVN